MGLFNFGKLVDSVGDAVGNAASVAKDAAGSAAKVVGETAGGAAAAVADTVGGAATAVMDGSAADAVANAAKDTAGNVAGAIESVAGLKEEELILSPKDGLTTRDALCLFYYELSADGKVVDDELAKFKEICSSFEEKVTDSELTTLVDECQERLDASQSSVNPLISVITCVDKLLYEPSTFTDLGDVFAPRSVIWNMLAIAYGDGDCADAERELVNHVAQVVEVEDAIVLELESYVLTIADLEREEAWIKTTDRPYLTIEAAVQDIEARKSAVMDGVSALIAL